MLLSATNAVFSYVLSKDAYMLVYVRLPNTMAQPDTPKQETSGPTTTSSTTAVATEPMPPRRASEVVEALNVAHDQACEAFDMKCMLSRSVTIILLLNRFRTGRKKQKRVSMTLDVKSWPSTNHGIYRVIPKYVSSYSFGDLRPLK